MRNLLAKLLDTFKAPLPGRSWEPCLGSPGAVRLVDGTTAAPGQILMQRRQGETVVYRAATVDEQKWVMGLNAW